MTHPDLEMRRCRKCNAVAVLPGIAWQHTTWSIRSNSVTRDFRCQACGAAFTVRPRPRLIGMLIAGILLIPTCVGLPLLAWVWWAWSQDAWNPVVPGAPPVARRFEDGPPARRCAKCGARCVATNITRNTHNGMPTGTEYAYTCSRCPHVFVVESPWGQIFSTFASTLVLVVGGCMFAFADGAWRWGGGLGLSAIALFMLGQVAVRFARRIQNPVDLRPAA